MTILFNLLSVLLMATKRLWANKGLALSLLLGWTAAVGITLSVPLYADAANHSLLRQQLDAVGQQRPPFAFLFRYIGAWNGAVDWEDVAPVDAYLSGPVAADIGLPVESAVRHFRTDNFRLFPISDVAYADQRQPLEWISVGFLSDLEDHVTLLEGTFPAAASPTAEVVEVLLHYDLADELGLQAGEEYVLFGQKGTMGRNGNPAQITVRIAGIWQPINPTDTYWFYRPVVFREQFLVPELSFRQRIVPVLEGGVYHGSWYMILNGSDVHSEHVLPLLGNIAATKTQAALLLPNTRLDYSPADALTRYYYAARLLTLLLSVFAIPLLGLILYFVVQVAGMTVRREQTEIAVLRSRGTSRWQVLGMYLLQGLVLGGIALGLGILLGQAIALVMGQIRSFLTLVNRPMLPVRLSSSNLRFAFGAVIVALVATLLPVLSAAAHTIVTHKQEQARSLRRPFWQRYFLDLFLLVPPLYGYYLLRQQGTISLNLGGGVTSDPFQNPLLFLVPTLFIFALSLVLIRIFPLLMSALAWVSGRFPGTPSVLALRHLARSSRDYVGPLLLLILTLGLAAFTASMALTLDRALVDQVYYETGGDLQLTETGESTEVSEYTYEFGLAQSETSATEEEEEAGPKWLFLPVSQHLEAEGVQAAARVGEYWARSTLSKREEGTFVGVDRVDFAGVASFRQDFATESLGGLMNLLALSPRALLVERGFLARNSLNVGDPLRLDLSMGGTRQTVEFAIAGTLDLFPTQYPDDEPFFVGNLDYAFQQMGDEYPYDVWLATDGRRPPEEIVADLKDIGFLVSSYDDAREIILEEQTQPSRQGLFGILSVGFLSSAGLTVLGFLLYAIFSFRQRFIELGVLRAIGLSVGQMAAFLAGEQLVLIITGAAAGTALGVWASRLFIPYLQVRGGPHPQTPPFVILIAWGDIFQIYVVLGGMLLVGVAVMLVLLARMRVFEAVKLGEVA
ncbi:MAG: FtsX-like permease family protein [Chloroflexota bacterium]